MAQLSRIARLSRIVRIAKSASLLVLLGCLVVFVVRTLHWPLISDAVLMQYVHLLLAHGMAPYRDIVDINMPGSYFLVACVQGAFGASALVWRLFDLGLLAVSGAAMLSLTGRSGAYAGLVAAALFALLHGADGVAQMNQRDYVMAVLSVAGVALLVRGRHAASTAVSAAFCAAAGLCLGAATTIKPQIAILPLLLIALLALKQKQSGSRTNPPGHSEQGGYNTNTPGHSERNRPASSACAVEGPAVDPPPILSATAFAAWRRRRASRAAGQLATGTAIAALMAGVLCAPAAALLWLVREHALLAFLATMRGLAVYHAGMARHTLGFLLLHAVPSPLLPLFLAALGLGILRRGWRGFTELALLAGCASGFVSYLLQGKAYPYHRYTLIVFLLAYLAVQLAAALRQTTKLQPIAKPQQAAKRSSHWTAGTTLAVLSLLYATVWLGPSSVAKALRYDWRDQPSLDQLAADLEHDGAGPIAGPVSGQVQCMDTMAGCITVLERLGLVQSTGFLYDCYFFAPGASPVKQRMRQAFWRQITAHPPRLFVVTDQWCLNLPSGYAKLAQWPRFAAYLAHGYNLVQQRSRGTGNWRYRATWPFGYRIYMRRDSSP